MSTGRQLRVERLLRREIASMVQRELKDPRIGFATITDVKTTPDFKHATVYVSTIEGPEQAARLMAGLRSAEGWITVQLIHRLRMKQVPAVHFEFDESFNEAQHIEQLLQQMKEETDESEASDSST